MELDQPYPIKLTQPPTPIERGQANGQRETVVQAFAALLVALMLDKDHEADQSSAQPPQSKAA
ncbi:hypothetical protein SE18_14820 [Herpetosiphon geysericola]|uniref:Uncharacterized protein n=1 Tax=Herpetosiphon geysericola TaxID=70996 RepID=A0A0P6YA36_9CHLR|nr:hypothetical protein SE18_14820 [Herpetosiphon geysericola]